MMKSVTCKFGIMEDTLITKTKHSNMENVVNEIDFFELEAFLKKKML